MFIFKQKIPILKSLILPDAYWDPMHGNFMKQMLKASDTLKHTRTFNERKHLNVSYMLLALNIGTLSDG